MPPRRPKLRSARSYLPFIAFLATCWIILFLVSNRFLLPVFTMAHDIDAPGRRQLAAISSLVLAIVLTGLVAMILLVVKPGRFFMPRKSPPRDRTRYVDAWAESGKRLDTPPSDE
jgi:hypothetical protein